MQKKHLNQATYFPDLRVDRLDPYCKWNVLEKRDGKEYCIASFSSSEKAHAHVTKLGGDHVPC